MKLCFVLPSVPHYRNGLFKSFTEDRTLKELIVLGGYGSSKKVIKTIKNPEGYKIHLQQLRTISLGKYSIKYQRGLLKMIFKERPSHIVMLYHMSILNHSFVPIVCKALGIKVYFWGSGSGEDSLIRGKEMSGIIKFKLLFKKQFYRLFDGILVYSFKHRQRLLCQKIRTPMRVAQNTCDIDRFLQFSISAKNENKVLFIGALESVKRLDVLIKALGQLYNTEWSLDIVGAGSQMHYLQKLTKELNLDDRVNFHGALYNEETNELWKLATHIILPGVGGLLINEAMAAGKYVLATSGDGTGEDLLLKDDLLSHDITVDILAKSITNLFTLKREVYLERCKRNRQYAVDNLRIDHMKREILTLLKIQINE